MPEDMKKLFQITEAARACSLSRSTLLRLEEKGLLTPTPRRTADAAITTTTTWPALCRSKS